MKTTNIHLCLQLVLLFTSCGNGNLEKQVESSTIINSAKATQRNSDTQLPAGFDTTGVFEAPVKILEYNLTDKLIDTFDNKSDNLHHDGHFKRSVYIHLKYKNVSSKRIIGLKLKWFVVDSFGNPSDLKSCDDCPKGVGIGITGSLTKYNLHDDIMIHQTLRNEWMQSSETGRKILLVAPVEVEFYDKTKWSLDRHKL